MFKKIVLYIIYLIVIIFALLAISSKLSIGGFRLLVVRSGSMEPAIKTGSIVIDKNFTDYNIGDIVTFKNKDKPSETTTHRIASKKYQGTTYLFSTKGDANDSADTEQITQDRILGKVIFSIPYFGYVTSFARSLLGLIILIIIPATIIIYEEILKIRREARKIKEKKKRKKIEVVEKKISEEREKQKVIGKRMDISGREKDY